MWTYDWLLHFTEVLIVAGCRVVDLVALPQWARTSNTLWKSSIFECPSSPRGTQDLHMLYPRACHYTRAQHELCANCMQVIHACMRSLTRTRLSHTQSMRELYTHACRYTRAIHELYTNDAHVTPSRMPLYSSYARAIHELSTNYTRMHAKLCDLYTMCVSNSPRFIHYACVHACHHTPKIHRKYTKHTQNAYEIYTNCV